LTTFVNEEARQHFERRKGRWLVYDEGSSSCALLLWDHFASAFGYRNPSYLTLVEWADKIDSARYDSVEEAIFGVSPALQIKMSLVLKDSRTLSENLVGALLRAPLEDVARTPEVVERFENARLMLEAGLSRFQKSSRSDDDGIVVFDVDASGVIVNRYAPYYFFPDARYSIGIVRSGNIATITAMRNPWREFPSAFLGRIFEKFGGGGHQRVGAVFLPENRIGEAPVVLTKVHQEIRNQDAVLVGTTTA
jgi:hypothetical protein